MTADQSLRPEISPRVAAFAILMVLLVSCTDKQIAEVEVWIPPLGVSQHGSTTVIELPPCLAGYDLGDVGLVDKESGFVWGAFAGDASIPMPKRLELGKVPAGYEERGELVTPLLSGHEYGVTVGLVGSGFAATDFVAEDIPSDGAVLVDGRRLSREEFESVACPEDLRPADQP